MQHQHQPPHRLQAACPTGEEVPHGRTLVAHRDVLSAAVDLHPLGAPRGPEAPRDASSASCADQPQCLRAYNVRLTIIQNQQDRLPSVSSP